MRILVTGGAGFIGSHLVDALMGNGDDVTILDNLSSGSLENLGSQRRSGFRFIRGDVRRSSDVRKATRNADKVFHLAACVGKSITDSQRDFKTNALGTFNVLKASKENNVERIVVASSVMIYGERKSRTAASETDPPNPIIPYGASKAAAEACSLAFYHSWGVPIAVLRYFNVYGPRCDPRNPYSGVVSRFMGRALHGLPPLVYGDGLQTRDFVYVGDVVRASLLAADRKKAVGQIINVGSGIGTPIVKLASMVLKATSLEHLKVKHTSPRPHEYRHIHADMAKARSILGYRPSVSLAQGLARTWQYLQKTE